MTDKERGILDMVLVQRREWDTTEPDRAPLRSWNDITGIEVHYTGAAGPKSLVFADKKQWLLNIERYHEQTKGWSDIFYNLFVFADGEVWLGRNPLVQSQGSLFNWLTVHVPGTVGMELTDIQKSKIAAMADIVGGSLRGHQERSATGCPGDSAMSFIRAYRAGSYKPVAPIDWEGIALWVEAVKTAHPDWVQTDEGRWYGWNGESVFEISAEQVAERAAAKAAEEAASKAAAEAASKAAAEEAARLAADLAAAEEAVRTEAAAQAAEEAASKAAAEEAARLAADLAAAAAQAAEEAARTEAAAQAAEAAARTEAARLTAEAEALKNERAVETDDVDEACCEPEPVADSAIGTLLRQLINWIVSIFSKR